MSIEWDSLILGGNELNTVGPATENAYSVRTRGTNSRGAPAERIGSAGVAREIWRRGRRQHLVGQHRGLVRDAVFHWQPVQRPQ